MVSAFDLEEVNAELEACTIWYTSIKEIISTNDNEWDGYLQILSPAEKKRVLQYRFDDDRRRALLSCFLQRAIVREYIQEESDNSFDILRSPENKPYAKLKSESYVGKSESTEKKSLDTWNFNLSHHGSYVGIVSHPELLVGADIVDLSTRTKLASCAEEYVSMFESQLHPEELRTILHQEGEDSKYKMFFVIWSLKESFIKALGIGLGFDLSSVCFKVRYNSNSKPGNSTNGFGKEGSNGSLHSLHSRYSAKSALSSTLNNNNNNNTEGQDFALFSPPPKSQYGTGNGRNGQGKEVREMARARTGSIESEKSSVSFRSNGSNGTYSSNYQDQYATGTGTRGTASVTLYPSVKNYSISSTRDGNMWSFSFFPLDEQHVMTVAKGQLEDSIPSFQRCAWGAALPTGYTKNTFQETATTPTLSALLQKPLPPAQPRSIHSLLCRHDCGMLPPSTPLSPPMVELTGRNDPSLLLPPPLQTHHMSSLSSGTGLGGVGTSDKRSRDQTNKSPLPAFSPLSPSPKGVKNRKKAFAKTSDVFKSDSSGVDSNKSDQSNLFKQYKQPNKPCDETNTASAALGIGLGLGETTQLQKNKQSQRNKQEDWKMIPDAAKAQLGSSSSTSAFAAAVSQSPRGERNLYVSSEFDFNSPANSPSIFRRVIDPSMAAAVPIRDHGRRSSEEEKKMDGDNYRSTGDNGESDDDDNNNVRDAEFPFVPPIDRSAEAEAALARAARKEGRDKNKGKSKSRYWGSHSSLRVPKCICM